MLNKILKILIHIFDALLILFVIAMITYLICTYSIPYHNGKLKFFIDYNNK